MSDDFFIRLERQLEAAELRESLSVDNVGVYEPPP